MGKKTGNSHRNYLLLIVTFIISLSMVLSTENIWIHINSMLLLCLIAIFTVKVDILHPYCWFSSFFGLYSIGHPLLTAIGVPSGIEYSYKSILYQLIALFICLLIIGPYNYTKKINDNSLNYSQFQIKTSGKNRRIYYFLLIIISLAAIYVSKMGFSGKAEIYSSGGVIINMIFRLPLVISLFFTILLISDYTKKKQISKKIIYITLCALLLITLFSGERDFVFRFLIILLFNFLFLNKISFRQLIVFVTIMIIIIPLSSMFKYYFVGGGIGESSEYGFLYSLIAGEFESASRNLQLLINNESFAKGCQGYVILINDVLGVINSKIASSVAWFNKTFYSDSVTEYGFSLVGEGYIIDGINGIVIVFVIVGLIIRYIYIHAFKNIYWLTAYFYFITVMIYAIRGDLGTIYSAMLKQIFLVVMFLKLLNKKYTIK